MARKVSDEVAEVIREVAAAEMRKGLAELQAALNDSGRLLEELTRDVRALLAARLEELQGGAA
jgi:hypothetical protein